MAWNWEADVVKMHRVVGKRAERKGSRTVPWSRQIPSPRATAGRQIIWETRSRGSWASRDKSARVAVAWKWNRLVSSKWSNECQSRGRTTKETSRCLVGSNVKPSSSWDVCCGKTQIKITSDWSRINWLLSCMVILSGKAAWRRDDLDSERRETVILGILGENVQMLVAMADAIVPHPMNPMDDISQAASCKRVLDPKYDFRGLTNDSDEAPRPIIPNRRNHKDRIGRGINYPNS